MKRIIVSVISHSIFAIAGFVLGIYVLPILTAPAVPTQNEMTRAEKQTEYRGVFRRDLEDSDFFHWGEGEISIGKEYISLKGRVAPGPDYKLYLAPHLVETEAKFNELKPKMVLVGDIKTFENFIVSVPSHINPSDFGAVIVWCESFGEFITAASYK